MSSGITRRAILGSALVPFLPRRARGEENVVRLLAERLVALIEPGGSTVPVGLRGQIYAWSWTYLGRAAIYHWQATGHEPFRDMFVRAARAIMAQRDDRLGKTDELQDRVVKSWGAPWPVDGREKRITDVTTTGLVSLPIVFFANTLESSDPLYPEFARYVEELKEGLFEYDHLYNVIPILGAGYYRSAVDPKELEALNHVLALGATTAEVYRFTRDERVLKRVEQLWRYFKRAIYVDRDGAASWAYIPNLYLPRWGTAEAFWKSAVCHEFPLSCWRAEICAEREDMVSFARQFTVDVLESDTRINVRTRDRRPRLSLHLDEPQTIDPQVKSLLPFVLKGLWYGDFEPTLAPRLQHYVKSFPHLFPDGLTEGIPIAAMARAYARWKGIPL
jgi:hypothetical protein